jgi:hypothetical protein
MHTIPTRAANHAAGTGVQTTVSGTVRMPTRRSMSTLPGVRGGAEEPVSLDHDRSRAFVFATMETLRDNSSTEQQVERYSFGWYSNPQCSHTESGHAGHCVKTHLVGLDTMHRLYSPEPFWFQQMYCSILQVLYRVFKGLLRYLNFNFLDGAEWQGILAVQDSQ